MNWAGYIVLGFLSAAATAQSYHLSLLSDRIEILSQQIDRQVGKQVTK